MFSAISTRNPAVIKSVLDGHNSENSGRKEIFVDVVEKINVTFSASGSMNASEIQGSIQVWAALSRSPATCSCAFMLLPTGCGICRLSKTT